MGELGAAELMHKKEYHFEIVSREISFVRRIIH